jgi:hypothetical protein
MTGRWDEEHPLQDMIEKAYWKEHPIQHGLSFAWAYGPYVCGVVGGIWLCLRGAWSMIPLGIGLGVIGWIVLSVLIRKLGVVVFNTHIMYALPLLSAGWIIGVVAAGAQRIIVLAWVLLIMGTFHQEGPAGFLFGFSIWLHPLILAMGRLQHEERMLYALLSWVILLVALYPVACIAVHYQILILMRALPWTLYVMAVVEMGITLSLLRPR